MSKCMRNMKRETRKESETEFGLVGFLGRGVSGTNLRKCSSSLRHCSKQGSK
jgi:hypothetical protein